MNDETRSYNEISKENAELRTENERLTADNAMLKGELNHRRTAMETANTLGTAPHLSSVEVSQNTSTYQGKGSDDE